MIKKIFKDKASRGVVFAVITVLVILLTLALNLLFTYIGAKNTLFVDTTYEGLYTLSDMMKEECAFIDKLDGDEKVKITFCADPDTLIDSPIMRAVYFMSLQLQNEFDKVEVIDDVNVIYNPTAVSKYKPTTLTEILPTDVIISYGDRYRVVSTNAFWTSTNTGILTSFFGEYKMASLIMSVTSINNPTAYFVTDHGESYYDADKPDRKENADVAYLYNMLTERGMATKTLELSKVDEIPEDCVLLIINNPKTDFITEKDNYDRLDYVSETDKLDRYLIKNHGSMMVAKDYATSLPVFEEFLYEWGFDLSDTLVKDDQSYIPNEDDTFTTIVAEYDTDVDSYGYAIYGEFASLKSSPSMIFNNSGYIKCSYGEEEGAYEPGTFDISRAYAPFFFTSPNAIAYDKNDDGEYVSPATKNSSLDVASVVTRLELDNITGEKKYSYIFCANSQDFFSNDILGNASYANYEVMSALTENMIRSDEYASMHLGSTSMNSANRGGKVLLDTEILESDLYTDGILITQGLTSTATVWYTVLLMTFPAAIAVVGIVVRIKRKFL